MSQTSDVMFEWNIADDTITYSHNWKDKFGYQPIQELSLIHILCQQLCNI